MGMRGLASSGAVCLVLSGQFVATVVRQVFDFLGYLWLPMLANFVNLVFVVFGIFGATHRRIFYLILYAFWTIVWVMWNVFLAIYYLELEKASHHLDHVFNKMSNNTSTTVVEKRLDWLSLDTGGHSFWAEHGWGCETEYFFDEDTNKEHKESTSLLPIRRVRGCLLHYEHVEAVQAFVHFALALLGFVLVSLLSRQVWLADQRAPSRVSMGSMRRSRPSSRKSNNGGHNSDIYSIEYSSPSMMNELLYSEMNTATNTSMTPRRVKRRSGGRGGSARSAKAFARNRRHGTSSRSLGQIGYNNENNNNVFNENNLENNTHLNNGESRAGRMSNPVMRLLGPMSASTALDSSTSNEESQRYGEINAGYEESGPSSSQYSVVHKSNQSNSSRPTSALTSYSNFHGQRKGLQTEQMELRPTINLPPMPPIRSQSVATTNNNMARPNNLLHSNLPENTLDEEEEEELPPPPPPAELAALTSHQQPVPQQRQAAKCENETLHRHEYVNMPYNMMDNELNATATLRVNDPLVQPSSNVANGGIQGGQQQAFHGGGCRCYRCQRKLTAI